jgi:hypothetical protein
MGMIRDFISIRLPVEYISQTKIESYANGRYLALTQLGNLDKRGLLFTFGKVMAELWKTDTWKSLLQNSI